MTIIAPPNFKKEYNVETFFAELKPFLIENMNPFITKMNTDRPDQTLKSINDAAYFFQTLNETTISHNPFIFYGESPNTVESANSATNKIYTVDLAVILSIGNQKPYDIGIELLRYRQIFEILFERGWNSVNNRVKLEISSMSPFPFKLTNSSDAYAGIGINLELALS